MTIKADCERSLTLLRSEEIDLLQLHTVDPNIPIEESVGALGELQRAGKVRMIGVCKVDLEQLARARSVTEIVSVQNRYSLERSTGKPVLEYCTDQ